MNLISSTGDTYRIGYNTWKNILNLARKFGWEPAGTKPNQEYLKKRYKNPEGGYDQQGINQEMDNWNGNYQTREGQIVSYADTLNLAFALEEAVKYGHKNLKPLIDFCKRGSFIIT
ncbi:MAG: hypothetical protein ACOC7U_02890 [Spirochaetota bacterium]